MDLEGIRNGGFEGKMVDKTSERPLQANSFFFGQKRRSRFLGNGIMILKVLLSKFYGFGGYLGYVCITLWAQG